MITEADILMGRDVKAPLSDKLKANIKDLVHKINMFEMFCPHALKVSSGYRPPEINAKIAGAAPNSAHALCMAVDFYDSSGKIDEWCLNNLKKLEVIGLYLEDPKSTVGWCHLTTRAPRSGKRVFIP